MWEVGRGHLGFVIAVLLPGTLVILPVLMGAVNSTSRTIA